jgi:hypothetical protein
MNDFERLQVGVTWQSLSNQSRVQFVRYPQKLNPLTEEARDMLLGTLLGDGCIRYAAQFLAYSANHCIQQQEYCQSKLDLLKDYSAMPTVQIADNLGWGSQVARFWTLSTPIFEFLRTMCYTRGTRGKLNKTVTQAWVDQLNWRQVAWWYQDDGGTQGRQMVFATHSFTQEEVRRLAQWFTDRGIKAYARATTKRDKTYWLLRVRAGSANLLTSKIRPYMHPTMLYKLPSQELVEGSCKLCGQPTSKTATHGVLPVYCSDSCRAEARLQSSRTFHLKMTPEQKRAKSAADRARVAASPELTERRNEVAKAWRKSLPEERATAYKELKNARRRMNKAAGNPEKPCQKHTCIYCSCQFSNSPTHKMSPRSPYISCPGASCMAKRAEDYAEIRRQRARTKWATSK